MVGSISLQGMSPFAFSCINLDVCLILSGLVEGLSVGRLYDGLPCLLGLVLDYPLSIVMIVKLWCILFV